MRVVALIVAALVVLGCSGWAFLWCRSALFKGIIALGLKAERRLVHLVAPASLKLMMKRLSAMCFTKKLE